MTKVKFVTLPVGSKFVSGNHRFEKLPNESYNDVAYNAKDLGLGDMWLFDDEDMVLDVTTSLVK